MLSAIKGGLRQLSVHCLDERLGCKHAVFGQLPVALSAFVSWEAQDPSVWLAACLRRAGVKTAVETAPWHMRRHWALTAVPRHCESEWFLFHCGVGQGGQST